VGVVPYRLIQIDDYNDVDIDGERVKLFSNRIVNCYKFVAMSIDFYDNTHTPVYQPFVRDYPGEPVPER